MRWFNTEMRNRVIRMIETWNDAGLNIRLSLTTGEVMTGRLEELDGDEVVLEPITDGVAGPITIVMLDHVVTASYVEA